MAAQMKRFTYLAIARALCDALEANQDALQALRDAYKLALKDFRERENDVDPGTIALGIQAQALGIRTLAQWLDAVSAVTTISYSAISKDALLDLEREMNGMGLVIPDVMLQ